MNLKELAEEFYNKTNLARKLIRDNIYYNNSLDIYPYQQGMSVSFMFRNECDYSLYIPYEYCEDGEKISDYYKRFTEFVKDESCLNTYNSKADEFFENEMKLIKESK